MKYAKKHHFVSFRAHICAYLCFFTPFFRPKIRVPPFLAQKPSKFRAFLKTSVRNYLANERARAGASKRGGGTLLVNLDFEDAEARYRLEPAATETPETAFEQRWAGTLLALTVENLRRELRERAGGDRWRRLEPFLTGQPVGYKEIANELGTSEATVKTTVFRMRRRFGQLLRQEVARTVERPEEIDREIRYLFSIIDR